MVNPKSLTLIKSLILLSVFISLSLSAFTAAEYKDSEYLVDEFSSKYINYQYDDFIKSDNGIIISGGCYNVEELSVKTDLKIKAPINGLVDFRLNHITYDDFEFNRTVFNYGISFNIMNFASAGFLANPTFYKKDSDISFILGFDGFNTKNLMTFTLDNFDNNYAHKNWNGALLPNPRIYLEQPYTFMFESKGDLKKLEFYTLFRRIFSSREEHYTYNETLDTFHYDYTADSASLYVFTQYKYLLEISEYKLEPGVSFTSLLMENGYYDDSSNIFENDNRIKGSVFAVISKSNLSLEFSGEMEYRGIDSIYEKNSYLLYGGARYIWKSLIVSLGEIVSDLSSEYLEDGIVKDSKQTRLLLTLTYKFGDNIYFTGRKGFETDWADIQDGGKYFFYDKGYVQFHMNFDNFFKREKING